MVDANSGISKPNFLIVGAARAGTTSLYEYLKLHPEIFMSQIKEPQYFVQGFGLFNRFNDYLELFRMAKGKKAIGEASTAYLFTVESPMWIRSMLGDIKIIIMLRNPAKRALSHYNYMVQQGFEDAATFEEALAKEPIRCQDPNFRAHNLAGDFTGYLYFAIGSYYVQVKRYLDTFSQDRIAIYLFEDFVRNPLLIYRKILTFLDVDSSFLPLIKIHNESRIPYSVWLQPWLRAKRGRHYEELLLKGRQHKLVTRLMGLNVRFGKKPKLSLALLRKLEESYRADVSQLEDLLGRDLSCWYEDPDLSRVQVERE